MVKKKNFSDWWGIALLVALFGLVFILSFRQVDAMDVAYQMKFADLVLHGNLPLTDPFTFSVSDHSYVCLNFFFDLVTLGMYRWGGFNLLSLYLPITVVGLFVLLYYFGKKLFAIKPRAWLWVGLMAIISLQYRFGVCSEQLALIYIILVIAANEKFRQTKNYKYLWFLPLIQLFWVNTQATFILGWIISGSYFLADWWQTKKFNTKFAWFGVSMAAVSLINPYTWRGAIFPFQSLSWFNGNDYFNNTISEYYTLPKFFTTTALGSQNGTFYSMIAFFIYFIVVTATYVLHYKKLKIYQWLPFLIFSCLTYKANRVLPFLVLLTFWPTAEFLSQPTCFTKLNRWWRKLWKNCSAVGQKVWLYITDGLFLIIIGAFSYGAISSQLYGLECARFGWGLQKNYVPYEAVKFIKNSGLKGRIINEYLYGGWLVLEQDNPVYLLGHLEVMGEDLYRESEYIQTKGQVEKLIKKYQPSMIFYRVSREQPYVTIYENLLKLGNWKLVYADNIIFIFATDEAINEAGLTEFNWQKIIDQYQIKTDWSDEEIKALINKKYQKSKLTDMATFLNDYGILSKWGDYLALAGKPELANIFLFNYLDQTDEYDYGTYLTLMKTFLVQKQYDLAAQTMKIIANDPEMEARRPALLLEVSQYQHLAKNQNSIEELVKVLQARMQNGDMNNFQILLQTAYDLDPENEDLLKIMEKIGFEKDGKENN